MRPVVWQISTSVLEEHSVYLFMLQCKPSIENSDTDIINEGTGPQFEMSNPVIEVQQGEDFIIHTKESLLLFTMHNE
jgi:hypothetical protein